MLHLNARDDTVTDTLDYTPDIEGLVPIPFHERDLPTAIAKPYFKVASGNDVALEGPVFDRNGNLLFVDIYSGRILRLTPDRQLTVVSSDPDLHPGGLAIHRDGRIFVAALGALNSKRRFDAGLVIAMNPDGSDRQEIVSPKTGHAIDDMVFDAQGGFYFSDFLGSSTQASGGIFYVPPDFSNIVPVIPHMCAANGVALSPDGKVLWATEYALNRLHRVELEAPGVVGRHASSVPYHFTGRAPDSMRTDSDGNVYVALNWQGRILVLNSYGIPIGQILLPGRESGMYLKSTSLALMPGSRNLLIVARDVLGSGGSMIFSARGFAEGFNVFDI